MIDREQVREAVQGIIQVAQETFNETVAEEEARLGRPLTVSERKHWARFIASATATHVTRRER